MDDMYKWKDFFADFDSFIKDRRFYSLEAQFSGLMPDSKRQECGPHPIGDVQFLVEILIDLSREMTGVATRAGKLQEEYLNQKKEFEEWAIQLLRGKGWVVEPEIFRV